MGTLESYSNLRGIIPNSCEALMFMVETGIRLEIYVTFMVRIITNSCRRRSDGGELAEEG